jgi:hypothetical protein
MTSITTRAGKGSPLTHNEVDANFTNLNNDKLDTAGIALGSAASPTLKFTGDPNTGIYSPGADQLAVSTGGTERLFVDASGNVGIGTIGPSASLDIVSASTGVAEFNGPANATVSFTGTSFAEGKIQCGGEFSIGSTNNFPTAFVTNNAERLRIDASGRLLVGTSSASGGYLNNNSLVHVQAEGASAGITIHRPTSFSALAGPYLVFSRSRGTPAVIVNSGDNLGSIEWGGADGTDVESTAALIRAEVDGTPGANDMPGRLVFSVTADGAASPTEALRISNDRSITVSDGGNVVLGTTTGTKIGTATTQKIAFYNATPVVQPTAVADATDAATVITQLNALLTRMRNLGLIAT